MGVKVYGSLCQSMGDSLCRCLQLGFSYGQLAVEPIHQEQIDLGFPTRLLQLHTNERGVRHTRILPSPTFVD